ncbi:FAD-dependent oxidoreductase [Amycolatopsis sp. NPDC023774]|uniref:FAD-dependent oxidoreductase n=1 Tax=Amycolatopsis sp. NPDC023774 TaxID=3155015 RepID=UPI0033C169C2
MKGNRRPDAIVVGSGVNGPAAAAELAGAGWPVTLVERNDRIGGCRTSRSRGRSTSWTRCR